MFGLPGSTIGEEALAIYHNMKALNGGNMKDKSYSATNLAENTAAPSQPILTQLGERVTKSRMQHEVFAADLSATSERAQQILSRIFGDEYTARVLKEYEAEQGPSECFPDYQDHSLVAAAFSAFDQSDQYTRDRKRQANYTRHMLGAILYGLDNGV